MVEPGTTDSAAGRISPALQPLPEPRPKFMYKPVLKLSLIMILAGVVTGIVTEGFRTWFGFQLVDPASDVGDVVIGASIFVPMGGLLLFGWAYWTNYYQGDPRHWTHWGDLGQILYRWLRRNQDRS